VEQLAVLEVLAALVAVGQAVVAAVLLELQTKAEAVVLQTQEQAHLAVLELSLSVLKTVQLPVLQARQQLFLLVLIRFINLMALGVLQYNGNIS
jgi:hypothetical protein